MAKYVFGLLAIFIVGGCQANSQYAGTAPLHIKASTAQTLERYFGSGKGAALAISANGVTGSTSCSSSRCVYSAGSSEKQALNICSKHAIDCKIFAINQDIVWKGPVSLTRENQTRFIVKLTERINSNYTKLSSGTSTLADGSQKGSLRVTISGQPCFGDFSVPEKVWDLKCAMGKPITGTIEQGEDSLFWGRSDDGRYEISIARKGWPLLEEKIRKHSATYSQNSLKTKAPDTPSSIETSKQENQTSEQ